MEMTNTSGNAASVRGTTADYNGCDCCGRENLKKYVVIDIDGETLHLGTGCAAKLLTVDAATIKTAARVADTAARATATAARAAARRAEIEAWETWLAANGEGDTTFEQIRSLGGFAAAAEAFNAAN